MRNALLFTLTVALAPTAYPQSILYTLAGDSPGDRFGWSASGAGDVNGDGHDDLVVGAYADDDNGDASGSARVFSGIDGAVLHTFAGDSPGDWFGETVSGAGDVDGDGFDDVIVGARNADSNVPGSGLARVFSGIDGSILHSLGGDSTGDAFGVSVSGAGDVNGDGFDDLIVGASADDPGGTNSGSARVFSGLDGSILHTFDGDSAGDLFGFAVSGAGDVNQDGFDDLIVGAYQDDNNGSNSGSARVFSGWDGATLYSLDGDSPGDQFGWSVSGAGDVNADGFADVIVGARLDDNNGPESGSARVFSGWDGSILHTFDGDAPDDWFGISVSGAGDVNQDGFDDLIVGAPGDNILSAMDLGSAGVFSGSDGSTLYTLEGDSLGSWFGISVSGAGDVNGDGIADLVVGASLSDSTGTARVFSACDMLGTSYCTPAVPNSSGASGILVVCGTDLTSANDVTLRAEQLPPHQFGFFLASQNQGLFMPPGSSGFICLGGNIGRYDGSIGQGPTFSLRIDLTSVPVNPPQAVQPGDTWYFQAWYRDIGNTNNFTDAVSVTWQ